MEWKFRLARDIEALIPLDARWIGILFGMLGLVGLILAIIESFYNGKTGLFGLFLFFSLTAGFFTFVMLG